MALRGWAAGRAAIGAGGTVTILGKYADLKPLMGQGYNILNLPEAEWSWEKNVEFLQAALQNGEIWFASELSQADGGFLKELQWLAQKGYIPKDWLP